MTTTTKIATAAWSGIAATLLIKGQTVHKTFKLPRKFESQQSTNLSVTSTLAEFLRQQDAFIVDEVSMMPVKAWRQLDGLFKDLNTNHTPMGGQIFILQVTLHKDCQLCHFQTKPASFNRAFLPGNIGTKSPFTD